MSESDGAEVESAQKDQSCETEGQTADVVAPEIAEEEEEDNDAASTASTSQSGRTESQVVGKKRKLKFVFEESDKGQQRIKALKITREGQPEHLIERSPLGVSADERSHLTHGDVTCLFQVLQQLHDKSRSASATDVALPPAPLNGRVKPPTTLTLQLQQNERATAKLTRTQPAELLQTTEDIIDVNRPTPVSIDPPYKPVCKLSPEVIEELSNEWEIRIRHDLWNREGYAYKPGGDKRGSTCGAFPHGIKEMTTGAFNGFEVYFVAGNRDVTLKISLAKKTAQHGQRFTEQSVLKLIHDCVPESERRNWTHRDRTLSFHVSMCFSDHDEINSDVNSDDYSFRRQDANCEWLNPSARPAPGSGGFYDFTLTNGCQIKKFHTLKAASHSNLSPSNANKKYMFKVVPLNPYLASIPSFYANSVPFVVKSNFHTECSNLAFILDDTGAVVADVKTNRVVSAGASRRT